MLKSCLVIALRNLRKQTLYAFINIFGLAVGIAFCALIFLFVQDELTFDRFHEKGDRIFRVHTVRYEPDGSVKDKSGYLPEPLGAAMAAEFPEVQQFVRYTERKHLVRQGERTFEEPVLYADASFFGVFTFPLEQGDPATALSELNSVVLSAKAARKYFGTADVAGRSISIRLADRFEDFTVTGVAEEVPSNSSIRFDIVAPVRKLLTFYNVGCEGNWGCSFLQTHVVLPANASRAALEAKMPAFWLRHNPEEMEGMRADGFWTGPSVPISYGLQPMQEIHLNPDVEGSLVPPSMPIYSYVLAGIALAVLAIACINFTTLAIGRSASRSKEIGVRKVVGANRAQLMRQFWGEALLLTSLALLAGLALAEILLPVFNELTGKALRFDYARSWATAAALGGILLTTGLLAGSYPALVLSGFRPVEALKGRLRLRGSNVLTRSLVVLQFGLVVFLAIGTLAMLRQLEYMRGRDLGFDQEQVVVISTYGADEETMQTFRAEVGRRNDVRGVTSLEHSFGRGYNMQGFTYGGEAKQTFIYRVASDFIDVMGIDLVAGRNFDPALVTDSTQAVLVNESFVREFGWKDPVGQALPGFTNRRVKDPVVVGVVRDFNFESLHSAVQPAMLHLTSNAPYVLVRIGQQDVRATVEAVRAAWEKVVPGVPFTHAFLDDDLARFYESEERWSRIVGYASVFAVVVACLGIFGLAALAVAGRTKEIGIRKVLGAGVGSLTVLLSRSFAGLVLLSVLIAVPAAYFAVSRWLEGFAYRIEIGPDLFALAGGAALLVAVATVSYQTIRAALADPVKSLRYE